MHCAGNLELLFMDIAWKNEADFTENVMRQVLRLAMQYCPKIPTESSLGLLSREMTHADKALWCGTETRALHRDIVELVFSKAMGYIPVRNWAAIEKNSDRIQKALQHPSTLAVFLRLKNEQLRRSALSLLPRAAVARR